MNKNFIILLLFLLPFFAGCEKGNDISEQEEGILVSLHDVSLSINDSRATPAEIGKPVADYFNIRITNKKTNQQVYDGKYTDRLIKTSVGSYSVEAFYGDNPELAFDAPYYYGSTETEVRTDEISSAVLNCTVGNSLVSVNFVNKDIFDQIYSSYGLKVSVGASSMTIDSQKSDKSVYFKANSNVSLSFVGVLKNTSEDISYSLDESVKDIFPLQAAKHAIINLRASNVGISIEKLEVNDVSVNETIPLEWLPKPKMTSEGFSNNAISFAETEKKEVTVNLNLSSPLQELKFKINSADPRFSGLEDREYLMSNIEDKNAIETALGITLPEIGTTEANINFSSLIPQLLTDNGTTVESRIEIDAKANDRWISEGETDASGRTFTFTCNKPDFFINVDEGNCWSKEFTINKATVNSGDEDKILSNLAYQYKENNSNEWLNCDQLVQFDDFPSNRQYQVRALYDGRISSNVLDVTLEEPKVLPNGNMDAWTSSTKEIKYALSKYYQPFFEPWGGGIEQWWDTNNNQSMPNPLPSVSNADYKCFPTVSYLIIKEGENNAALIRTVNADGFFSTSSNAAGENYRGVLYAGITNSDGTLNEGRDWQSRPTGMSFNYRYNSYDNERFGAYIEIYSGENKIASGSYVSVNGVSVTDFTNATISLDYTDTFSKATSIRIRFCSVAEGDNPAVQKNVQVNVPEGSENYYNIHGGSVLTVDDISLVYGR